MTDSIADCGEAGHAEGRCGTAECLRGAAPVWVQPCPGDHNTASPWLLELHQGLANLHRNTTDTYWRGYLGAMLLHIESLAGEPPRQCGCPQWCGDGACERDRSATFEIRTAAEALVRAATIMGVVLTVEQVPRVPLAMGNHLTVVHVRNARGAAC